MRRFWERHPLTTNVVGGLLTTGILAAIPAVRHFYALVIHWLALALSVPVTVPLGRLLVFLLSPLLAVEAFRLIQRRRRMSKAAVGLEQPLPPTPPITDDRDQRVVLLTWARQNSDALYGVIRFADLDRNLNLAPGAAKRHIRSVAASLEYYPVEEGSESVTFTYSPHIEDSWSRPGSF